MIPGFCKWYKIFLLEDHKVWSLVKKNEVTIIGDVQDDTFQCKGGPRVAKVWSVIGA